MKLELTSGCQGKEKIKGFGLLELLGGIAIILTLFTLIGPSIVSNISTMKKDIMGKEEYLLNSALSQAVSLGAENPNDKNQALLLVSSKIDLPDMQFGPLLTGLPPQQMTIGDITYQLELVDEKFKYIPLVEVATPEPDPTGQALDLEEEEALALPTPSEGDFAQLEGVVMCGGGISNNSILNGSLVILKAEGPQPSITLGNNVIVGDLFCPGTPTIKGTVSAIIDLDGEPEPSNYTVTVRNNAMTGTVYRRVNSASIPAVEVPFGLEQQGSAVVNNTASVMPLPAGHYQSITMDGPDSVVTLGVPGSQYPVHYQVDSLEMFNGGHLKLAGPVILTFTGDPGTTINLENNMIIGNPDHPEWLDLRMYSGNLRVANNGALYGKVTSPNGSVHFDNNAQFTGGVAAKYFTMANNTEGVVFNVSFEELLRPW